MNKNTKIIHIDMDCFYAAIEARNKPQLREKPLGVGGRPEERGVICTCNYIARKYGVHSAMSAAKALRLCPNLVIVKPDIQLYSNVSREIHKIFYQFTALVEPFSLDEAFLDVSNCNLLHGSATLIAEEIRRRIFVSQKLTASAGVAPNKFLSKIASDWRKPNGIFVITPEQVQGFVARLPVQKIFGVGQVTAKKLLALGVKTCADLQQYPTDELIEHFGSFGAKLYELSRGIDERPVEPNRVRKSLSVEHTFAIDLTAKDECIPKIVELHHELKRRLQKVKGKSIAKQFVKIKFSDFHQITRECTAGTIALSNFIELFRHGFEQQNKAVRLIGIGVRFKPRNP